MYGWVLPTSTQSPVHILHTISLFDSGHPHMSEAPTNKETTNTTVQTIKETTLPSINYSNKGMSDAFRGAEFTLSVSGKTSDEAYKNFKKTMDYLTELEESIQQ